MVTATLRKSPTTTNKAAPVVQPTIDVEATVTNVGTPGPAEDFDSTLGLAAALETDKLAEAAGATSEEVTQTGGESLEPGNPSETAVAVRQSQLPAEYSAQSDPGGLSGEWGAEDIKLPRMVVVNGSGPLSNEYAQGTVLLADNQLLGPPDLKDKTKNPVVRFVPVDIFPQYRENLSQEERDNEVIPRVVNTRAQAMSLGKPEDWEGGVMDYVGSNKPRWQRSGRVVLLIEEPAGTEHPGFSLILDGKNWAPAVYYASGTAWPGIKQIYNTSLGFRNGTDPKPYLPLKVWTFQIFKKSFTSFGVFMPAYTLTKELTGGELREHIKTMVSPAAIKATENAQ